MRDLMALGTRPRHGRLHASDLAPLRALSAMYGDWGLPPSRGAALAALGVIADYSEGAFFPKGGGGALLRALVDAAQAHGATFRTRAAARRILVSHGRVVGVELEDGEPLAADVVVSDVDPTVTLGRLVAPEHLPPGARGEDYRAFKEQLADRILREVETRLPGLVGDIAVREVATPLTWLDFLRAPHGGVYGPAMTPRQAGLFRFRTRTPVEGLFLAGQGVLSMGVSPVLLSGRLAARAAERYSERRGRLRQHLGEGRTWDSEAHAPPF